MCTELSSVHFLQKKAHNYFQPGFGEVESDKPQNK